MKLFSAGYGYWPSTQRIEQLTKVLQDAGVNLVIDIRISPCSSNTRPGGPYGPREWNLQAGPQGLVPHLAKTQIDYRWLVELGNPQKTDPEMTVLRAHLASADLRWPANRGLALLREIIHQENRVCCLLCACAQFSKCHRKVVAESFRNRFLPELVIHDLNPENSGTHQVLP